MSRQKCTLLLDELICKKTTGECGHDEIYLKIWTDGCYWGTFPRNANKGNTLDMNDSGDSHRKVALNLQLEYGQSVKIEVREQDQCWNSGSDEVINHFTINTSDVDYGDIEIKTNTVSGEKATYDIHWRLLSQKVPSLRLLGLSCEQSSANCNKEVIDAVSGVVTNVLDNSSKVLGYVKTPKAQAMSKAFEEASLTIQAVVAVGEWMANAIEGDDDVYLQQVYHGEQANDGAGFCPPNGDVIKMNKGDSAYFLNDFDQYFRFPLDKESVTIELRERDSLGHDVSLGSLKVDINDFNNHCDKGAFVIVLTDYLDKQGGQGAVYKACFSFAMEDWALSPNQDIE